VKTQTKPLVHRLQKYIPSEIDLYPCYPGGMARVAFMELSNGLWRVCIWGADDCGYEYDQPDYETGLKVYNDLTHLTGIPTEFHHA
jgi:hypothetical protein